MIFNISNLPENSSHILENQLTIWSQKCLVRNLKGMKFVIYNILVNIKYLTIILTLAQAILETLLGF